MDRNVIPDEKGCWRKEKVLGAGGFGYVILWQNKETKKTIAIKQCRWGNDSMMTPKHCSRWKLELNIMFKLDHPNVVKALNVPPELDVPATELPVLAMEYCSGGDLRKMLNRPENCCGLQENHVRLLLKHISSAVNYLHSMGIIHRDLKPENIVIQESNGSMLFKLIDLGYAKDLDQGSLCTSFVGTLQYLAPELFMSKNYSCTVDYWSLGLVTHEVITGLRPFLPDKSPVEWMLVIKDKNPSQIRAFLDEDKNIVFSEEISPFNHICSILKRDIESWLQIMLEFDSQKRGRCQDSSAFIVLDRILDKKVLYIFCVNSLETLCFPVDTVSSTEALQRLLELHTKIPIHEQEIILPKGSKPCPEQGISQFLPNNDEEDIGAFLLSTNGNFVSMMPSSEIPPAVEKMMKNPRVVVEYLEQRSTWSQAVHLSQHEHTIVGRLIRAFRVNLMNLLLDLTEFRKNSEKMNIEVNRLAGKSSIFKNSLELDIVSYEAQAGTGGFTSKSMFDSWEKSYENLKKIDILKKKVASLEKQASDISMQTVDLQRTPYAKSKITNSMEEIHQKVLGAYGDLKRRGKEQRYVSHDNADMVRLLCESIQLRCSSVQDVAILIRQTNNIKKNIKEIIPQITHVLQEISEWDSQICSWQFKRQREMWKVVDALVCKFHGLEYSSSPLHLSCSSQPSFQTSTSNHVSQKPKLNNDHDLSSSPQNISNHVIPASVVAPEIKPLTTGSAYLTERNPPASRFPFPGSSLSTMVEQSLQESNRIKQENSEVVKSFEQLMNLLKNDFKNGPLRVEETFQQ